MPNLSKGVADGILVGIWHFSELSAKGMTRRGSRKPPSLLLYVYCVGSLVFLTCFPGDVDGFGGVQASFLVALLDD